MKYVMLIHHGDTPTPLEPERWAEVPPEQQRAIYAGWKELNETPGLTPGHGLQHPTTGTTVRVRDGEVLVTDGPFAELREAVGGFGVLEVDDLDQAIAIAAKVPSAGLGGAVEIRPIQEW